MLARLSTVLLLFTASLTLAGEEEVGAATLRLHSGQGAYKSAVQLQARVHFRISGLIAHVQLEQEFRNDSGDWVEAEYLFPLPEDAAVNRLELVVGERVIIGEIKEKQAAREIYQQAKASGRKAGLVEQRRPNLFSNKIANIAPAEIIKVKLQYVQRIHYDDGEFSLRFPMTVTPRYKGGSDVWQFQNPTPASKAQPIQPIAISAELDMGLPLESIVAPYHQVALTRQRQIYQLALAEGQVPMDRDFVLQWRPQAGSEPQAALFHESVAGEDYALLMVLPPRSSAKQAALPRELVFVIDTSGSMGGSSITQARASLAFALEQLRAGDSFNVIEFSNRARQLFSSSLPLNAHNLARAREFVRHLDAGGGTEMLPALQLALPDRVESELLRQVVFITDGAVGNEVELFREIERRLGDSRLFTVGIGSAPNSWFMRKAAQLGGGRFTFIGDVMDVQEKMQELFTHLSQTLLTDFRIDWPTAVETYPARIPDLYPGEPIVVAARARADTDGQPLLVGEVQVHGRSTAEPWQRTLTVPSQNHTGVASIWARQKIGALLDEKFLGRDAGSVRDAVLPVALKHQLLSPYTSFVAVEQQVSRAEDAPLKNTPVPNLRPEGQAPQTHAWPRTATPASLQLLSGLLALLIASFQLGSGGWIHMKAELAQALIARAWASPVPAKPWPWADTYPLARLQIPTLEVDQYVLAGQQGNALAFGPGHVSTSAQPGQGGTTIIAGHRDTHFSFIGELQVGDQLSLTDKGQRVYRYRVVDHFIADINQQTLEQESGLLLVTCYPFDAINPGGPLRYVVVAQAV